MIIGTWSGHRKRLKDSLERRTSTGSREAASWHYFTVKRNRRSLQCLERGHLTWSCSKEYWVTRRVFKLLPMCQNHLRPLMQFPRLETPFFVASMATASNPSKSGFHNRVHIQTHFRSIIQSQEKSFSNLGLSDPRPGVESKLHHDLATISSFVKPYRRLTTSRRIPCVVLLLWHTRRYGSSYPPSLVVGIRTSHLDAGEHFRGLNQVARQIQASCRRS